MAITVLRLRSCRAHALLVRASASSPASGVQMENLVHDLPIPVDLKQCEQIGKPMPGPVVEFQPHRGNRPDDVDAGNPGLESRCRTVLVIPVKELLDGASKQVGTH